MRRRFPLRRCWKNKSNHWPKDYYHNHSNIDDDDDDCNNDDGWWNTTSDSWSYQPVYLILGWLSWHPMDPLRPSFIIISLAKPRCTIIFFSLPDKYVHEISNTVFLNLLFYILKFWYCLIFSWHIIKALKKPFKLLFSKKLSVHVNHLQRGQWVMSNMNTILL